MTGLAKQRYTSSSSKMNSCTKLLYNQPSRTKYFVRYLAAKAGGDKADKKSDKKECVSNCEVKCNYPPPKLKLPVPPLNETMSRFLKSAKPFMACDEMCRTEAIVQAFQTPGGPGEELQTYIEEKACRCDNWLEDWWLNSAYLGFRNPVVFYSSPGQIFPRQTFCCEEEYIMCAAKVAWGALDYKDIIDGGKLKVEKAGDTTLEMEQYCKVFGTNRSPDCPLDSLRFCSNADYIIVMHNNHFVKLCVKKGGKNMDIPELFHNLTEIIRCTMCPAPPIGILTSDDRDSWTENYRRLMQDPTNCASVKEVEGSLFILCLDRICPCPLVNNMSTTSAQVVHGGGPNANSGNRWFDKTIQFVICRDGGVGIAYEHSPAEGGVIANLMDHIVPVLDKKVEYKEPPPNICVNELPFCLDDSLKCSLNQSMLNLNDLVNNTDFNCFCFGQFGKEEIKRLNVSPDSFIQMAIQLAFYKLHGCAGAQYETGSLRRYLRGRTETIRSTTEDSMRMVEAVMNPELSCISKGRAILAAISTHKKLTIEAMTMKGVDRHMLGLRLAAQELCRPEPCIFTDPAWLRSTHFRISTSQVPSKCDGFMVYGPLTNDGYAVCYNPREKNINFGISTFACDPRVCATNMRNSLEISLEELRAILAQMPPPCKM